MSLQDSLSPILWNYFLSRKHCWQQYSVQKISTAGQIDSKTHLYGTSRGQVLRHNWPWRSPGTCVSHPLLTIFCLIQRIQGQRQHRVAWAAWLTGNLRKKKNTAISTNHQRFFAPNQKKRDVTGESFKSLLWCHGEPPLLSTLCNRNSTSLMTDLSNVIHFFWQSSCKSHHSEQERAHAS